MMQAGWRIGREIRLQSVDARLRRRGMSVVFRRVSNCYSRGDRAVVVVMLQWRPGALEPLEAPVWFLKRPNSLERFASQRMKFPRRQRVVQSQGPSGRDNLG